MGILDMTDDQHVMVVFPPNNTQKALIFLNSKSARRLSQTASKMLARFQDRPLLLVRTPEGGWAFVDAATWLHENHPLDYLEFPSKVESFLDWLARTWRPIRPLRVKRVHIPISALEETKPEVIEEEIEEEEDEIPLGRTRLRETPTRLTRRGRRDPR